MPKVRAFGGRFCAGGVASQGTVTDERTYVPYHCMYVRHCMHGSTSIVEQARYIPVCCGGFTAISATIVSGRVYQSVVSVTDGLHGQARLSMTPTYCRRSRLAKPQCLLQQIPLSKREMSGDDVLQLLIIIHRAEGSDEASCEFHVIHPPLPTHTHTRTNLHSELFDHVCVKMSFKPLLQAVPCFDTFQALFARWRSIQY